jgi:hypothetical protein
MKNLEQDLISRVDQTASPLYKHDCNTCQFLGRFEEFDLYFCESSFPTVIARYGKEEKYKSGMCFATPDIDQSLYAAKLVAIEKGIYNESEN